MIKDFFTDARTYMAGIVAAAMIVPSCTTRDMPDVAKVDIKATKTDNGISTIDSLATGKVYLRSLRTGATVEFIMPHDTKNIFTGEYHRFTDNNLSFASIDDTVNIDKNKTLYIQTR